MNLLSNIELACPGNCLRLSPEHRFHVAFLNIMIDNLEEDTWEDQNKILLFSTIWFKLDLHSLGFQAVGIRELYLDTSRKMVDLLHF